VRSNWYARFIIVCALIAGATALLFNYNRLERIPHPPSLSEFPQQIAGLQGRDEPMSPDVLALLGPGNFLTRLYSAPRSVPVDLLIAYFPTQKNGDRLHSPKNCLPGSGWYPVSTSSMQMPVLEGTPLDVNRIVVSNGSQRLMVLYWYQAHGRVVHSEYSARYYLIADALRTNRTDGGMVRVITPIGSGEAEDIAEQRAVHFAQAVVPQLDTYIPR
jgi:EpsI family protein